MIAKTVFVVLVYAWITVCAVIATCATWISVREYKSAVSLSGWIPMSERTPEKSGHYLVSLDRTGRTRNMIQHVSVDRYNSMAQTWTVYGEHVVAWMPTPRGYSDFSWESIRHGVI